jgi:hypothetical protein
MREAISRRVVNWLLPGGSQTANLDTTTDWQGPPPPITVQKADGPEAALQNVYHHLLKTVLREWIEQNEQIVSSD